MIKLPDEYNNKVINRYGIKGRAWLEKIDLIIDKYIKKFDLTNVLLANDLSINVVLFADSKKYGKVILKVLAPTLVSINEINYMKMCSDNFFAKCYFYDKEDRVMLLEKLMPGYPLSKVDNQNERIDIFCYIMNGIVNDSLSIKGFKTLDDTFKERFNYALNHKEEYVYIYNEINYAISVYEDIKRMNLPKYVLHDDLHHKNILKVENGWKVIDPHGIVGERVFETAQFIRSELSLSSLNYLDLVVSKVSEKLNEQKTLIYKALYVYLISKVIFHVKIKHNLGKILKNIEICEKIKIYL